MNECEHFFKFQNKTSSPQAYLVKRKGCEYFLWSFLSISVFPEGFSERHVSFITYLAYNSYKRTGINAKPGG